MAQCPTHDVPSDACFLRRKSDKKYYRGAKYWRFTKSWRRAALMGVSGWKIQFELNKFLQTSRDDFEFVFLNEALDSEVDPFFR